MSVRTVTNFFSRGGVTGPRNTPRIGRDTGAVHKQRYINSTVCYAVGLFACQTRCFGDNSTAGQSITLKTAAHTLHAASND
jgi:hypothetical protein